MGVHIYSCDINMAARSLVPNSSLCFLIDKYGKLTSKSLKSMMLDFYDIAELCGAKMQLLSDVKKMRLTGHGVRLDDFRPYILQL